MEIDYENLFYQVLGALINQNGGSLESAMDEAKITDLELRKQIRKEVQWDEE